MKKLFRHRFLILIQKSLLATTLFLLLAAKQMEARDIQVNDPLTGIVLDAESEESIPGASVQIEELDRGVAADADGEFMIPNVSVGTYTLRVRSIGYQQRIVTVRHPAESGLTIRLEQQTLEGEDIIVTGSPLGRNVHYQPAQSMNAETLQRKAAPSLGEILDGSPGVTTRSYGSAPARPVIRGFDGDRVLVLQNGERMGDLSSTAVDHAVAMDPLSMDRVEVVRGPASLLYGSSAIGGVVNMFSNDMPQQWDRGASGTVATHAATMNKMGAGLLRGQYGTDRFAVTGRMIYRDGGDLQTPEGRLPDTALQNISFGGGAGYRAGLFEAGVSLSGMDYTYGLPESIDDPNESIEIRMNRVNLQGLSTWDLNRLIDHAELRVQYSDYRHDEVGIVREPDGTASESVDISFSQQSVSSSLTLRHRPAGSAEGAIGFSMNYSEIAVGGVDALTPNASGYFLAGYLYEEFTLSEILTLKTGGRIELKKTFVKPNELFPDAEAFEDRSDRILSGAIGLNMSPAANWTAGIQAARAYRTPSVEELYSFAAHAAAGSFDIGDPNLENEYSLGLDLFLKHRSGPLQAELSLFANRIDHYVDFFPTGEVHEPSGLPVFQYGSKNVHLYGFEIFAEAALSDRWSAGAGVDFVRGKERTDVQNNLTFMPPLRTSLHLMYDDTRIWGGPRVRVVSPQRHVAPNEEATDGYLLIGADAGYRFGEGVTLSLRLDNLLNEKYRDHLSRVENRDAPMPGRNLNLMLRWTF
ncbi:MAG: TonB-dependent receptor [Balneolaceae bacterium]